MTPDVRALRVALRRTLPPEVFEPRPIRGWLGFAEAAAALVLAIGVATLEPRWFVALPLSLAIGQLLTASSLAAHEAMHGAVFRRRWANVLLAWVGLGPLWITPGTWVAWHVQAHHGHTNIGRLDPDALFDVDQLRTSRIARLRARMTLGTESRWLSVLSLAVLFAVQGQLFLWVQCDDPGLRDRVTLNRTRERALTVGLVAGWVALGAWLGWPTALWVLGIPFATHNLTLMAYVSTQHWLRPQVDGDDPLASTVSVAVPRWADALHFGFSYHQEHHLFPRVSHRHGPAIRAATERIRPGSTTVLPWGRALWAVFATPTTHRDRTTLTTADGRQVVDLRRVLPPPTGWGEPARDPGAEPVEPTVEPGGAFG
ncbi:MAG: fatty acid desaturase [Myxococcota bacterium]